MNVFFSNDKYWMIWKQIYEVNVHLKRPYYAKENIPHTFHAIITRDPLVTPQKRLELVNNVC